MSNYDDDFYAWALDQAKALRSGDSTALDMLHLAEEVEDLGRSERRAMISHLRVLLTHLLKWNFQPDRRSESWLHSMGNAQVELQTILQESPSLRPELPTFVTIAYDQARMLAARETVEPAWRFPSDCPWLPEQLLDPVVIPYKER
jgi:hypothetical protein